MSPHDVGLSIAPLGITLVLFPLVLPSMLKAVGALQCMRFSTAVFFGVNFFIPQLFWLKNSGGGLWVALVSISLVRGVGGMTCARTCEKAHRCASHCPCEQCCLPHSTTP